MASAWAAGLLTLEEAVQVVYYRSAEQQKLAGCGRLLAVGLGQNAALEFLAEQGFEAEVEIACVNAPTSAVLAGSEATLERVKAALPEGTFGAFVPGNIAFHSSHVEPILPEIRRRLAFLDDPARASLRPLDAPLFVSTVTGEEQGTADARYWCENVRRAVVFEHAVNCIFAEEGTAPDLVLEIGPHKTLAGPLLQIVKGMGREAAALPTLKRGEECAAVMAGLLGELFKQGVRVEMQGFYDGLGYQQVRRWLVVFFSGVGWFGCVLVAGLTYTDSDPPLPLHPQPTHTNTNTQNRWTCPSTPTSRRACTSTCRSTSGRSGPAATWRGRWRAPSRPAPSRWRSATAPASRWSVGLCCLVGGG